MFIEPAQRVWELRLSLISTQHMLDIIHASLDKICLFYAHASHLVTHRKTKYTKFRKRRDPLYPSVLDVLHLLLSILSFPRAFINAICGWQYDEMARLHQATLHLL